MRPERFELPAFWFVGRPRSAFMVGLVTYAILGLIVGAIIACFSLVKGADTGGRPFGFAFGPGAIVAFPIIYGISGAICGGIGAAIYNLVAGWIGGLDVDIS